MVEVTDDLRLITTDHSKEDLDQAILVFRELAQWLRVIK